VASLRNRRVQVLGLLSLSSGMPLGFVTSALQVFLRGARLQLPIKRIAADQFQSLGRQGLDFLVEFPDLIRL